jgi:Carboxypeptidase regulatory-like domain/TonB-dependent Receptor Plug Domain
MRSQRVLRSFRFATCCVVTLGATATSPFALRAQTPTAPTQAIVGQRGYIVGQVIDRASGRPIQAVNVTVIGTTLRTQTDLDGRYRIPAPAGVYSVRAFRLGSVATQQDGIRVVVGQSVTASFALGTAVVQLQAIAVTATTTKTSSDDALLAMQRTSSRVSDGISAEAIKRTPGTNAGDAVVRVTGVSIVDNKFAVVRGLSERYSNTLLNGVELPSPEPLKKIVPLDLFPSSLLESIVVSKTATPDKPGDFAGGSVEVTTKEFPNDRVAEINLTTGYGSQATLRDIPHLPQRGVDWLGFDQGRRRQMPTPIPQQGDVSPAAERFSEQLRNVWTPTPKPIIPDFGGSVNLGGRFGGENAPIGYAVSGSYNRQTEATPNRQLLLLFTEDPSTPTSGFTSNEATTSINLGAIANLAARLGSTQKLGWKNLYTRNAEERLSTTNGFDLDGTPVERRTNQVRYITRSLAQTQLTGEHLIAPLLNSRLEWRATLALASRDEPENRSLQYLKGSTSTGFALATSNPSQTWFRFLEDRVRSAQVDWSVPITRVVREGSLLKVGGFRRERARDFDSYFFRVLPNNAPEFLPIRQLPPEQIYSPEVLGGNAIRLERVNILSSPYRADDNVQSFYAMVDLPVRENLRFVGGLRREAWALDLRIKSQSDTSGVTTSRRTTDNLLSGNLTLKLSDRQNLRLAAYQTVARPDPREISDDYYIAVANECGNIGNPDLLSTQITNADIRWERYAKAGEILAFSGFAKRFTSPISERVRFELGGACAIQPFNLESAQLFGGEFEVRRPLTMLPGPLKRIAAGLNITVVNSKATEPPFADSFAKRTFRLQGQSDFLANLNFQYASDNGRTDGSLLFNYFSDRIARYGITQLSPETKTVKSVPNVTERGRLSIDAKLRRRIGRGTYSLSARNLADAEVIFYQDSKNGRVRTGYLRPGITFSLGAGYAIR